jgi:hypothetical protein
MLGLAVARFPDVDISTDMTRCRQCLQTFQPHDRITRLLVVTGVGIHEGRKQLFVMDRREVAHVDCQDHRLTHRASPALIETPRQRLAVTKDRNIIRARYNEFTCTDCRTELRRGDRILQVMIVIGIGIDPAIMAPAVECSEEFEVAHKSCDDRDLSAGPGALVLSS